MLKNPKHEAFAQAVALGSSAAEAYRVHVSGGKCSDRTAEVNSSLLLKQGTEVSLRLSVLRKSVAETVQTAFNMTKDQWLKRLSKIADQAEDNGDFSAATGALDKIGKAASWYAPEKVEHSGSVAIPGLEEAVKSVFAPKV